MRGREVLEGFFFLSDCHLPRQHRLLVEEFQLSVGFDIAILIRRLGIGFFLFFVIIVGLSALQKLQRVLKGVVRFVVFVDLLQLIARLFDNLYLLDQLLDVFHVLLGFVINNIRNSLIILTVPRGLLQLAQEFTRFQLRVHVVFAACFGVLLMLVGGGGGPVFGTAHSLVVGG